MIPLIQIAGLAALRGQIRAVDPALVIHIKEINKEAAEDVADRARAMVPKRTGALAGTIRASGIAKGAVVRAGFAAVPYAGPIHFGWPNRPNPGRRWRGAPLSPHPFLFDALDQRRKQIEDLYDRRLGELTDRIFPG